MSNVTKIWLIIAASLILVGGIIFGGVMASLKWDFTKLSTVKHETNTYEMNEEFSNISINTDTADLFFLPSEDGKGKVVCFEKTNSKHSVAVQDGTLTINAVDERKWYEHIGITTGTSTITVYLPETEYNKLSIKESTGDIELPNNFQFESIDISASTGDITNYASSEAIQIKTSTGDIRVENVSADTIDLSVSTGRITLSNTICEGDVNINVSTGDTQLIDVQCKSIISNGNTGDISLKNTIATEIFSIERTTGDVRFDDCDAAEIFVKTDTGDVNGTLLSDKVFITETDTGSINVPNSTTGGKCEITTDTGDIKITID